MKYAFVKYQGTGNDFIMLDNLDGKFDGLTVKQIQHLCHRKLGIGADGLIKLSAHQSLDFEVEYYNSDGSQSFCGNGARCSVAYARELGLCRGTTEFMAIDGAHKANINDNLFSIEMRPVDGIEVIGNDYFTNTGSPHYMRISHDEIDIVEFGREIRYSERFKKDGVNVNVINEEAPGVLNVSTYERGVEDETLSCGTGVTACALLYLHLNPDFQSEVKIITKGGELFVSAERNETNHGFSNIWLTGPAINVFSGFVEL